MERIKERILQILSEKCLNVNRASAMLDIPQRTLNRQLNEGGGVSTELLRALHRCFPDVSLDWILSGDGTMYKQAAACDVASSPYYDSLSVSAGLRDVVDGGREIPAGYVSIPNMRAEFFFPVSGTSMQPEINPGDIIGVNSVAPSFSIDKDKIYMIVTREGRMIKHCSHHEKDEALLMCSSPNYHTFALRKDEIIAMYEVVVRISNI